MLEFIKKIIKKEKYNSKTYIDYLRKIGVEVGENCKIYSPNKTEIDVQNPYMLTIGNNVKIATGVKILTHDFSWCVTSNIDGYITGSVGKVSIGNNVFIGMGAIITRNVFVGDNVIIGAGSIVTHDCESGYVYGGIPAKKLMSIQDYHKKRKDNQLQDAKLVATEYYKKTGKIPDENILREFLFLFADRNKIDNEVIEKLLKDSGHYDICKDCFLKTKPKFKNIEEFLEYCGINKEQKNENSNDRT